MPFTSLFSILYQPHFRSSERATRSESILNLYLNALSILQFSRTHYNEVLVLLTLLLGYTAYLATIATVNTWLYPRGHVGIVTWACGLMPFAVIGCLEITWLASLLWVEEEPREATCDKYNWNEIITWPLWAFNISSDGLFNSFYYLLQLRKLFHYRLRLNRMLAIWQEFYEQ